MTKMTWMKIWEGIDAFFDPWGIARRPHQEPEGTDRGPERGVVTRGTLLYVISAYTEHSISPVVATTSEPAARAHAEACNAYHHAKPTTTATRDEATLGEIEKNSKRLAEWAAQHPGGETCWTAIGYTVTTLPLLPNDSGVQPTPLGLLHGQMHDDTLPMKKS